jgi:hypothetical protein
MGEFDRAQSIQLGALFLFGFAILGLSLFQLYAVPAQNEEVEFKHEATVEEDFQRLRSAVLNAGADGAPRSVTVSKGPTYPTRFLLANGPEPGGSFRTVSTGTGAFASTAVNFTNVCGLGGTDSLAANHVAYEPDYNYYSERSPHRYENTIYYREGGSSLLNRTGQVFVSPAQSATGGTINIYPIRDSFDSYGTGATTVQFVGGRTGSASYSDFAMTVPTRLSPDQWDQLVPGDDVNTADTGADNMTEFTFTGSWTVNCRPIGVGSAPQQADTDAITGGGDSETEINPNFDTGVIYRESSVRNNDATTVDITFENRGSADREMVEARFAFYSGDGQGSSGGNSGLQSAEFNESTLDYIGAYEDISVTFPSDTDTGKTVPITFSCNNGGYDVGTGDYFVLSIIFEDGTTNTYFIAPSGGKSGKSGCK